MQVHDQPNSIVLDFQKQCGSWAVERDDPWVYIGWICRNPVGPRLKGERSFEELVQRAKKSDHGEIREVDIYSYGAVCWLMEKQSESSPT